MTVDATPILVGAGQFAEAPDAPGYRALGPIDVAAEAARRAFDDALSLEKLAPHVDLVATTRTFHDTTPLLATPFGTSNNFPRSIARRLGLDPERAIWEDAGGNSPQDLVSEACERLAAGEARAVLLAGGEAISTARHLLAHGQQADWSDRVVGSVESRLTDSRTLISDSEIRHRLFGAPVVYALCEHARRARLGLSRAAYAAQMGRLFAPFTQVAAANPYAAVRRVHSAEELVTVTERNRMIADPYPRLLVARDQVNQGAALVLTTVGLARSLGIPAERWVFLHGSAKVQERRLLERVDLGASIAAHLAARAALAAAGIAANDVACFDLYSCFPIAVSNVCDGLGLAADDPRGLTVTGGLPYFGGPGNDYSMHAIASTVERVRSKPGSFGFVGANGGILSKYSVGIYSTQPAPFRACDGAPLQAEVDASAAVAVEPQPQGRAAIETYTVVYGKDGRPSTGLVAGRVPNGARFLAATRAGDAATLARLVDSDPLGAAIDVTAGGAGPNHFGFAD